MPTNHIQPIYYHVYNRGVNKQMIFLDKTDKERFLTQIKGFRIKDGVQLVDIHGFCLLDNHFHLLIEEVSIGGLSKYMQRLGTGYMMYFNKKYERSGRILEASYKSIQIQNSSHFLHLFRYIHLNSLKYLFPNWKMGVVDIERAVAFVRRCRWSSLKSVFDNTELDWVNNSIIESEFRSFDEYRFFLTDWIRYGCPQLNQGLTLEG